MAGWSVRTRALTCPICGARLRWDAEAPIIECGYCQTHVVVETGRVTDQPAAAIAEARKRRRLPVVAGVIALVVIVGAFVRLLMPIGPSDRRPPSERPTPTSTVAELVAIPLDTTAAAMTARFGLRMTGRELRIVLADGAFAEARLAWATDAADHVSEITLTPRIPSDLAGVVERARDQLGRHRLRQTAADTYQFHAKGVWLQVSTTLSIGTSDRTTAGWHERFALLWTVVKGAALGTQDRLDTRARRDVLNLAYTVSEVAAIGFDVVLEDAAREVHRIAPGADSDGARHTLGIEHPWIDSAVLQWQNAPRGPWTQVTLYLHPELALADLSVPLIACLAPVLGEPKRLVADHAKGTFTLQYPARRGRPWVDVGERTIQLYPHYTFGEPATAEGLRAVLGALAGCGA